MLQLVKTYAVQHYALWPILQLVTLLQPTTMHQLYAALNYNYAMLTLNVPLLALDDLYSQPEGAYH